MHFDSETLSLSVAKTARELEKVYDEHGSASSAAIDLFKIYLLQFVLDDTSVYSPYIREQSLIVLREKIHKKEYIGMGNIEQDPKAVERVLNQVANELAHEVKSIEQLINNPNVLSEKLENWRLFVEVEKNLQTKYKNVQPALRDQLETIIVADDRSLFDQFKLDVENQYSKQIHTIKMGIRLGRNLSAVCAEAEKKFVSDVRDCFAHALKNIEKSDQVSEYHKQRFWAQVDHLLNRYEQAPQKFNLAVQQYREKSYDDVESFSDQGKSFSSFS